MVMKYRWDCICAVSSCVHHAYMYYKEKQFLTTKKAEWPTCYLNFVSWNSWASQSANKLNNVYVQVRTEKALPIVPLGFKK